MQNMINAEKIAMENYEIFGSPSLTKTVHELALTTILPVVVLETPNQHLFAVASAKTAVAASE